MNHASDSVLTPEFPPIDDISKFDRNSGGLLERLLFNHRIAWISVCLVLTVALGIAATGLRLNASFLKTIPTHHPFVVNYLGHAKDIQGTSNAVRIAVETRGDTIYDAAYLDVLRQLSDELYLLPGVDRAYMKSLWTPATRWTGVTEDGFDGGPVVPDNYDGSPESVAALRANVERSGEIGQLVAPDFRSSIVYLPLLDIDHDMGRQLDYGALSARLDTLREKYDGKGVKIRIVGFAKVMGDLIGGLRVMLGFFGAAIAITSLTLFFFTRCWRSSALVIGCTLTGIIWLLGLLPLLGYEFNPYSILIPFLVYAVGVSHAAQKMNGILQDIARGTHKLIAARYTFRRLFVAGVTALLADAVGFAILGLVDVPVIRELAVIASLGVAILVFTNLALLPILLSYTGVSGRAAQRALQRDSTMERTRSVWTMLAGLTRGKAATIVILVAVMFGILAFGTARHLRIGDLDAGAPELRAASTYNRDNAFVVQNYRASSDVFVVMVKTPPGQCAQYQRLQMVDALELRLREVPGVEGTQSLASLTRQSMVGMNEGYPKWADLIANQELINAGAARAPRELFNPTCDLLSVYAYLRDHKAETLAAVVAAVEDFRARHPSQDTQILLAAGNAGIEAATNIVVEDANHKMLLWVYGAVILLCFIAFRSWRAVVCTVLPLMLTSVLAEALMVWLGMGVKVATLPVVALGVGIGVDYALYNLSVTMSGLRQGATLAQAYYQALTFTGRVVVFTGMTLSLCVLTWVFSPIKFQADMGILLAFMFLVNMIGALVLVPAIACFVLRPTSPGTDAARDDANKNSSFIIPQ
ncbi:efflux RND transporter permease subunit [Cupriavidus necator]